MKNQFLMVVVMSLAMLTMASAYEVYDSTPKNLVIKPGGEILSFNAGTQSQGSLEAYGDTDGLTYIIVQHEDGTLEYVPQLYSSSLEWFMANHIKQYTSSSECSSKCTIYATSYCANFGKQLIAPSCDGAWCNAECGSDIKPGCTSDSQCAVSKSCTYCILSEYRCDSGTCRNRVCGTATQCGVGCTSNSEAKSDCLRQYEGSTKAVVGAECVNGQPVCKTDSRGEVECSGPGDPICSRLAQSACTYGVKGASCTTREDCVNNIYWSKCNWVCNNAPVTQICGDGACTGGETCTICSKDCGTCGGTQPPQTTCGNGKCDSLDYQYCPSECASTEYCGNGKCEGYENERTCSQDCGDTVRCGNGLCESGESYSTCGADCPDKPDCTPGEVGEPYCDGKDIVQKYKSGSCAEYTDTVDRCDIACEGGACIGEIPPNPDVCGDGTCGPTESPQSCLEDCDNERCGNLICELGEDFGTCSTDCGRKIDGGGGIDDTTLLMIVGGIAVVGIIIIFFLMRNPKKRRR